MDYTFDAGPSVRGIVLDGIAATRRASRSAPPSSAGCAQQLRAAGNRWVVVVAHQPLARSASGRAALALLDRDRHVVAALSGDTHNNRIAPRRTAAGGYWLISTGSLADWPMQARMLRVRATAGGGAVLETWMLDTGARPAARHRPPARLPRRPGRPPAGLARRTRSDRNVRLYLP